MLGKHAIRAFAALKQAQDLVEVGPSFGNIGSKRGLLLLDAEESSADAVLLALEKLDRDRVGVVGLEETLLFAENLALFSS